jgi:YD repeat-containing protein
MKNTIFTIAILLFGFSAKAQVTATYTYDNLHRLTQASYSNGVGIQYSYDQLGNRTQETKTSTLSVADFEKTKSFTLFPNPFQEELQIASKDRNITQVQLFDLTGKLIKEEKGNNQNSFTLKTNGLPVGTYIITIFTDNGRESYKVIKKPH